MSEYQQPKPFLLRGDEDKRRAQRDKPKAHERATAKSLGGRTTPASGALESNKGDVRDVEAGIFEFLIECKRTEGKSLRVEGAWLDKITREAKRKLGRSPALSLEFDQVRDAEARWVAVPESVMKRMLEQLGEEVPW